VPGVTKTAAGAVLSPTPYVDPEIAGNHGPALLSTFTETAAADVTPAKVKRVTAIIDLQTIMKLHQLNGVKRAKIEKGSTSLI
jgi:hypothetical protein